MLKRYIFLISLLLTFVIASPARIAMAATPASPGSGVRISPVRQDVTLAPGGQQSVGISVQNLTDAAVTVQSVISDFTASSDETGQPQLLLNPKSAPPARSFKTLTSGVEPFTLAAGERKVVPLQLTAPATASAGGYYGAVRFAASNNQTASGATLTASTGTIFLVTVSGNISQKLSLASIDVGLGNSTGRFFMGAPNFAQARFTNSGTVHVQPYGKLVVKNWSGKTIQQVEVNTTNPRGSVLPDSTRKFAVNLKKSATIGMYSMEGSFSYGTSGQVLTASKKFYVVPYQLLIGLGIVILLAVFVIPLLIRAIRRRRRQAAETEPPVSG